MEAILSLLFVLFSVAIPFIGFFFVAGLIVLVVILAVIFRKNQLSSWTVFARDAGLSIDQGGWFRSPTVSGAYKGYNVYLYTYTQGSGKNRTTYTSMIVYLPVAHRAHVRVTREGFLSKITKAFGAQDVQVGDPAFDAAYVVKSDTPDLVAALLTPPIRGALLSGGSVMNVTVSRGRVFYTQTGIQHDAAVLRYVLDVLVLVAGRVVEMEASQPAQAPPVQMPPLSVCDNCGADLDWQADGSRGMARCEYCGKEMVVRFRTVALRGR